MSILGVDVGRLNLGLCLLRPGADASVDVVERWAVLESGGAQARDVHACLETAGVRAWLAPDTAVVIERQPAKNPSMTRIQHYLEMYFAAQPTTVQDPKNKLYYAATTPWWPAGSEEREWTYRRRKRLAIDTAAAFAVGQPPEVRAVFEASRKKDDLADALLHAMAFAHAPRRPPPLAHDVGKVTKVTARAPTARQLRSGLSMSNVKHLLRGAADADEVASRASAHPALRRAIAKWFGDAAGAFRIL